MAIRGSLEKSKNEHKLSKKQKKLIVNGLTMSRIIGALALPAVINFASIPVLIGLLSTLLVTDFLDGKLSRHWKVQTMGGALLDPLSDKLLAVSCLLSFLGTQSFLIMPLFLELGITAINVSRALHEENVKSTIIGKIKTAILSVSIVLTAINVLNPELLNSLGSLIAPNVSLPDLTVSEETVKNAFGLTTSVQVLTAANYVKESIKQRDIRSEKIAKLKSTREMLLRLFDETKYEEDKDLPLVKVLKK